MVRGGARPPARYQAEWNGTFLIALFTSVWNLGEKMYFEIFGMSSRLQTKGQKTKIFSAEADLTLYVTLHNCLYKGAGSYWRLSYLEEELSMQYTTTSHMALLEQENIDPTWAALYESLMDWIEVWPLIQHKEVNMSVRLTYVPAIRM
jgi:hypothetical protein